ncbi:hypothetical protein [Oceanibaculum nanhaiense]|uniref:hypothetical protein n=1 Tax=Oceanibaculum nanhaiense TaxID=1909734 RepID=UPI003D2C5D5C
MHVRHGLGMGPRRRIEEDRIREAGLDPADRRLRLTLALARELIGFPRHLSQHVGGFVITRRAAACAGPDRERGDGGPHHRRMGQG